MASVKSRRPYRSRIRAEQAAQTRLRILEVSGQLFAERGYATTTIEAVATHAGVAVDTVYAIFGSKRGLISALIDLRVTGSSDESDVLAGEGPRALQQLTDQREIIAAFAKDIATRVERVRPVDDVIRSAAAIDPDIADLRGRMQENRFSKLRTFIERLVTNGALRNSMDVDEATAIVWTLTSTDVNHLLRDACNWSVEQYVAWLADTLTRTLLH